VNLAAPMRWVPQENGSCSARPSSGAAPEVFSPPPCAPAYLMWLGLTGTEKRPRQAAPGCAHCPGIVSNTVSPAGIRAAHSGLSRQKSATVGRKSAGSSSEPA